MNIKKDQFKRFYNVSFAPLYIAFIVWWGGAELLFEAYNDVLIRGLEEFHTPTQNEREVFERDQAKLRRTFREEENRWELKREELEAQRKVRLAEQKAEIDKLFEDLNLSTFDYYEKKRIADGYKQAHPIKDLDGLTWEDVKYEYVPVGIGSYEDFVRSRRPEYLSFMISNNDVFVTVLVVLFFPLAFYINWWLLNLVFRFLRRLGVYIVKG